MAAVMTIKVREGNASVPVSGGGTRDMAWDGTTVPTVYGLDEIWAACVSEYLSNENTGSADYIVSVSSSGVE